MFREEGKTVIPPDYRGGMAKGERLFSVGDRTPLSDAAPKKARPHTKMIGDQTEAMVMARLLQVYPVVLLPFGENQRYDMVVDDGERFLKVQCKTGRLKGGAIIFATCSSTYHHPNNQGMRFYRHLYRDQVDLFGIYCRQTDGVYLVPVDEVGTSLGSLRIAAPKNNQSKKVRWAADYELRVPG